MKNFDVIVIGAGHAGLEAAAASARIGAKTALISSSIENIGELSCNPAIGGIGKGTIVREIDALGGVMGILADQSSIHTKMLNESKGPAVWGLRAQIDRKLYKKAAQSLILNYKNLEFIEGMVSGMNIENGKFQYVVVGQEKIFAKSLVITTGTFLNGLIYRGLERINQGRIDEKPSNDLGDCLKNLGFKMGRLKTGTPPRIYTDSIDFSNLEKQYGDTPPRPFSYLTDKLTNKQIECHITYTNNNGHDILRNSKSVSPILSGDLASRGPRYCPSIEDKIRRFPEKDRHQIFLEPEGLDSDLIYPNGMSTSMPPEVQEAFFKSISGLENCKIAQYGYAIEYDFIDSTTLDDTLQLKGLYGLYFAGQINGTTGYEEAAGQGLVAGVNAALNAIDKNQEFTLHRENSFIGVMIDDLTQIGVGGEPYRMFTSRAENRLLIRHDNADIRLGEIAKKFGLLSTEREVKLSEKINEINNAKNILSEEYYTPNNLLNFDIKIAQDGVKRTALELLRNRHVDVKDISKLSHKFQNLSEEIKEVINIESKYHFYITRQLEENLSIVANREMKIPEDFSYKHIKSLSAEIIEKLDNKKPKNILQAMKIPGITPSAIGSIIIKLKNNDR
jgi:tRNA uridine 5-carboxymethylaminomethyl modification enzyme